MSGFVALVGFDAAPLDEDLLDGMVASMAFRGPDGNATWIGRRAMLGCASLRTGNAPPGGQPTSLDGQVWGTGCVRLDACNERRARLGDTTGLDLREASDLELVLAAYIAGGEDALEDLRGEFAFALWDERSRRLVCARDPFGVRSLYHARAGDQFLVGNTLETIRRHPGISRELDELSVADFLMFGRIWDLDRTSFVGVRRLPPGHLLTACEGDVRTRRYWTLPVSACAPPVRSVDAVHGFLEHFTRAVEERTGSDDCAVFMSGGLDSTMVAAHAKRAVEKRGMGSPLACTMVLDKALSRTDWRPMPSEEESSYAGSVAGHLGLDHRIIEISDAPLYERWQAGRDLPPEPIDIPQLGALTDVTRNLAKDRRVALTGEGGDACFRPPAARAGARGLRLLRGIARFMRERRHLPTLSWRSRVSRRLGRSAWRPTFPPWFDPDLEARHDLRSRWETWLDALPRSVVPKPGELEDEGPRPEARRDLLSPYWPHVFWGWDPEVTRAPLEVRHPFFDPGLVEFLLALPPIPWFWDKLLLREAASCSLPEAVRRRPKAIDRVSARHRLVLKEGSKAMMANDHALLALEPYVRIAALRRLVAAPERLLSNEIRLVTRPLTLGWWLNHLDRQNAL